MSTITAGDFFDLIWGEAPEGGWVTLATFPRGVFDKSSGPTKEAWFKWPDQREELLATVASNKTKDLYFCPVVFKEKLKVSKDSKTGNRIREYGRRAENAAWLGVVYADADDCEPEKFKLKPSITVQTSSGRHHTYWVLRNPTGDVKEATRSGRVIAYTHAEDGCDLGGWDITQLLRVPQTTNNKGAAFEVSATASGELYTLEAIDEAYPTESVPERTYTETAKMPTDMPTRVQALAQVSGVPGVAELLRTKGRAPTKDTPGNRSELMWALLCALAEGGVDRKSAFVLAWSTEYNKYRQRNMPQSMFWAELCKAYDHIGVGDDSSEIDTTPSDEDIEEAESKDVVALSLLSQEERDNIPVTIVDRYMAWAKTRTDANSHFQQAAFMTTLATVFGEYGLTSTKHERGYLNLWFMVLGGTTQSRKSTVRRMMLRMLSHLSDHDYVYDLGSEATAEGLHSELLDRGKGGLARSSLYHKDEVQEHKKVQGAKQYMAGMDAMMTELYDGMVPGRLRSGETKKSCEAVFHVYMTGIEQDVYNNYQITDFGNGHLARFLFVRADPPPLTKESTQIEQEDEDADNFDSGIGREYDLLLDEIRKARAWWQNDVGVEPGKQVRVYWEADAWKRLNQIRLVALTWADKHRHRKLVTPTVQRSLTATLRMATLLAMVERSRKVRMPHLLRATQILEECIGYMEIIMRGVDSSAYDRMVEDMEVFIMNQGTKGISIHALYKQFRKDVGTPEQLRKLLGELKFSGSIKIDGKKVSSAV